MRTLSRSRLLPALGLAGLVACTQPTFSTGPNGGGTFRVSPSGATIQPGQALRLQPMVADPTDRHLSPSVVHWSSSDLQVANVTPDGVVYGGRPGVAEVTGIYGADRAVVSVAVEDGAACGAPAGAAGPARVPEGCPPVVN